MLKRRTIDQFIIPVNQIDDLPAPVAAALKQFHLETPICSMLVIPPQDYAVARFGRWGKVLPFGWRITPQRTLVFTEERLLVVEADMSGNVLRTLTIPFDAVIAVRLCLVLLYAYAEITWMGDGQVETLKLEFNAVDQYLLCRQIDQMRGRIAPAVAHPEDVPFIMGEDTAMEHFPLKFQNYLCLNLLPDEQMMFTLYQAPICCAGGLRQRFQPLLSPHRAVAITDRELIVAEDTEIRQRLTYGILMTFCPLRHIREAHFAPTPEGVWVRLALTEETVDHAVGMLVSRNGAQALHQALQHIVHVVPSDFHSEEAPLAVPLSA